jgi:uncharacterized protein (TIGR00369 family)
VIDAAHRLAGLLEATPYASRLGLRCGDVLTDTATASVPYLADLANAQGFVHGGVAASLSIWTASLVAVASDRGREASALPVSASIAYLSAAREEGLHATARMTARGRDVVHVEVEVASDRGRIVASALMVIRTLEAAGAGAVVSRDSFAVPSNDAEFLSPFSRSMGAVVRSHRAPSAQMMMPLGPNAGLGGAIDPGALVSLADTCSALACVPSLDERVRGSATLSLAAVFARPLAGPAVATGWAIADGGSIKSARIEIGPLQETAAGAAPAAASVAMTALVTYRFAAWP